MLNSHPKNPLEIENEYLQQTTVDSALEKVSPLEYGRKFCWDIPNLNYPQISHTLADLFNPR